MAKKPAALTTEWPGATLWKLDDIKPYPKNPKQHPDAQVDLLAQLLRKYGPDQPIVVDEAGEIIKGHGRRLAAYKASMTQFPVVQRFGLSDEDKRAMRIADNQIPLMAGWDVELMKFEVGELKAKGYDIALLGFGSRELSTWTRVSYQTTPDTTPPAPKVPFVRAGDLWKLGDHFLLCGDSTKKEDVDHLLSFREVDQVVTAVTDPPYGIDYEYREHKDDKAANVDLVKAVMANCPEARIWTPGKMNLPRDLAMVPDAKVLCWHKKFAQAGSGLGGASTWEPVLVVGIEDPHLPDDYLPFPTDREASPHDDKKMLRDDHPCPKPVALFEHLIVSLTPIGSLVFEPFSGSGTTLIACHMAGRVFSGIEIDPIYVELAITRWQQFTGKEASLDGKSFEKVRLERNKKRQPVKAGAGSSKTNRR